MTSKNVFQIVDDLNYVRTNCYQHQLFQVLHSECNLTTLALNDLSFFRIRDLDKFDTIISTLKLRTIDRIGVHLASMLRGKSIVVYDQDPFESCRDDGPHFGAHERVVTTLNVERFVVTTKKYADHMNSKGMKTNFERIWMLPEYCDVGKKYIDRRTKVAFMGSMHSWRKNLIDNVKRAGIDVTLGTNSKSYHEYLQDLHDVKIFICSHDSQMMMDGSIQDARHGMYHKDVEVASRGCFSISDRSVENTSYIDSEMKSVILFDHVDQVPDIIRSIEMMDDEKRQSIIDRTVQRIKERDCWRDTAKTLIR